MFHIGRPTKEFWHPCRCLKCTFLEIEACCTVCIIVFTRGNLVINCGGVYSSTGWSTQMYGNLDCGGGSCQTMQYHGAWPHSTLLGLSLVLGGYRHELLSWIQQWYIVLKTYLENIFRVLYCMVPKDWISQVLQNHWNYTLSHARRSRNRWRGWEFTFSHAAWLVLTFIRLCHFCVTWQE
jgi:hypothetical protein